MDKAKQIQALKYLTQKNELIIQKLIELKKIKSRTDIHIKKLDPRDDQF